jgi:hypothetical protein
MSSCKEDEAKGLTDDIKNNGRTEQDVKHTTETHDQTQDAKEEIENPTTNKVKYT